jgi:hypothetical protein
MAETAKELESNRNALRTIRILLEFPLIREVCVPGVVQVYTLSYPESWERERIFPVK